jgi:hypothetical protein
MAASPEKPPMVRTFTSNRLLQSETEIAYKSLVLKVKTLNVLIVTNLKEWIESLLKEELKGEFFASIENGRSPFSAVLTLLQVSYYVA